MNAYRGALSDEYGATPLGVAEFDVFVKENPQVQYVDCVFSDICGVVRGKRIALAELEQVFRAGLPIPYTIYFLDARGDMTGPQGNGPADNGAEGNAWPVSGTLMRVNWSQRPHGQVLMTLTDARGEPYFGEPRNVLKRIAARFTDLELKPVVATGLAFYLIDREGAKATGVPRPPAVPGVEQGEESIDGSHGDLPGEIARAIAEAAAGQSLSASATPSQAAPGQFAIDLDPAIALKSGDNAVFARQLVRAVARTHGLDATFMAKPYLGLAGSDLNVGVELRHATGKNVFDDGSVEGSDLLRHALGGLQAVMAESMALFAPNANAYRRFAANGSAPRNKRWGRANRTAGMGVSGLGEARIVRHRIAGADANPYLVLAAILAGIHHGISQQIDPGPAFEGNAATFVDETIPSNIDAALIALENGSIIREYLGRSYVDLYCATKRTELERFRNAIPAHEYDWYL